MATQTLTIILLGTIVLLSLATLLYFLLRKTSPSLLVLVVEKIGVPPASSRLKEEWTTPQVLEKTIEKLTKKGFSFLSLADLKSKKPLPQKPVILAFIGGYQTVFTEALALLKKHHLKACVFLSPNFVASYNAWQSPEEESWQNMLTAKQIKSLQTSRLISFGAMGLNGQDLSLLSTQEALFELSESAFRLNKLFGLQAEGFVWNSNLKTKEKNLAEFSHQLGNLPLLTFQKGINPLEEKIIFRTLHLGKTPLYTALQIFKQR
jgi:hypothetical protein